VKNVICHANGNKMKKSVRDLKFASMRALVGFCGKRTRAIDLEFCLQDGGVL